MQSACLWHCRVRTDLMFGWRLPCGHAALCCVVLVTLLSLSELVLGQQLQPWAFCQDI
jgi:hypothetical protein